MINDTQTRTHLRGRVPFGSNDYGNVKNNNKVCYADLTDAKPTASSLFWHQFIHLNIS
jgi:hypothetical protein